MAHETVRIGIVGAGENTRRRHIPGLQEIEDVKIMAVCNRTQTSSQRVAAEFSIPKTYDSWEELVEDPQIDAVVIGTWPYMHCPVTLAALATGKHVLCEARMAMNLDEARRMKAMADAHPELVAQVVPSPFSLRVDQTIHRLIKEGYLGDVLALEVRAASGFLDPDAPMSWRQNREYSGLNVLTLGIWYEAIMRWIGCAREVQAMGKVFVERRRDKQRKLHRVEIPEHLVVLADMECGAQAHLFCSSVAGFAGPPEARIYGSLGTLRFVNNRLYGGRPDEEYLKEIVIPEEEEGHWRVEEEFIGAIRNQDAVKLTRFEDGVKYMAFTEAVHHSQTIGGKVAVEM
jgi:predicted dehydrogenase